MQDNEKVTSELLEDFDPIEKMTYSLDPLKDLQAFHDFFNVEVKIPENEREFNEKLILFHQMAPTMSEEESNETLEALQNLYEIEKNGKIQEDDLPF
ncbi:hypothetical protein [Acinetobacter lwoffii]|uniref:hypothetical protein n=1 Tax=Acinetobacter lwoffii TaxID=28090 RepID=UPI003BF6F588